MYPFEDVLEQQIMEVIKMKKVKAFAIVNIVVGVIFTISGVIMIPDDSTYPGPFIVIPLGLLFWIVGGMTHKNAKEFGDDVSRLGKMKTVNTVLFVIGCILLAACLILPIVAPMID